MYNTHSLYNSNRRCRAAQMLLEDDSNLKTVVATCFTVATIRTRKSMILV